MAKERNERQARLTHDHPGSWSTMSAEYFHVVGLLFDRSRRTDAKGISRSLWVYAALPVLIAGVQAFLIEYERMFMLRVHNRRAGQNELQEVIKDFDLPDELSEDIAALVQIRNEVVHPATPGLMTGTYPHYVKRFQELGLIDSHTAESGAEVLSLIASHRLFEWAIKRCIELLHLIVASDPQRVWLFRNLVGNLEKALDKDSDYF